MNITKKVTAGIITVLLLAPLAVSALSIEQVGGTIGLGTADLKSTIVNIINWVLALLGLIAVIMILIGGFQWMTAGGNEEKVASAKKVISAAVIGLIIVLLAWAIVTFVVRTTSNVSGV